MKIAGAFKSLDRLSQIYESDVSIRGGMYIDHVCSFYSLNSQSIPCRAPGPRKDFSDLNTYLTFSRRKAGMC